MKVLFISEGLSPRVRVERLNRLGYFDFAEVKRLRENGIRNLSEDCKVVVWAWLGLFSEQASVRDVKEDFHRLAFKGKI